MSKLQFAHIEYSINTKSLDIFTIGCNGKCVGCCNSEIKKWCNIGMSVYDTTYKILQLNKKFDNMIDRVIIVGGDPVDGYLYDNFSMNFLLNSINEGIKKPIFLFTRYEIEKVPQDIKNRVQYIKTGEYKPELLVDKNMWYGINLATSNQKIYKKVKSDWILQRSEEWK